MYKQGRRSLDPSEGCLHPEPAPTSPIASQSQRLSCFSPSRAFPSANPIPSHPIPTNQLSLFLPKKCKCDVRERMWVSLNSNDQRKKKAETEIFLCQIREKLKEVCRKTNRQRPREVVKSRVAGDFLLIRHADVGHRGLQRAGVLRH